jgi:hypothetical protein
MDEDELERLRRPVTQREQTCDFQKEAAAFAEVTPDPLSSRRHGRTASQQAVTEEPFADGA